MGSLPTVSIIIPTYNYADFIIDAINSVLEQHYPADKIEIVVVDDGSTDLTREQLDPLIESKQISYYYQENSGKAAATYHAVQKTSGKYIFNLDADDYFLPGKIETVIGIFESDQTLVHVGNAAQFIIDGKECGREEFPEDISGRSMDGVEMLSYFYNKMTMFGGGSTFAAKGDILRATFIPAQADMYIDEFLILAVLNQGKSYLLNKTLSVWRGHSNNYTVKKLTTNEKSQRLDNSSKGILDELMKGDYPGEIKKLYALKHFSRHIFFKESADKKNLNEVLAFAKFCFWSNRFSLKQLRTYSVFNRFLPIFMIRQLRRQK